MKTAVKQENANDWKQQKCLKLDLSGTKTPTKLQNIKYHRFMSRNSKCSFLHTSTLMEILSDFPFNTQNIDLIISLPYFYLQKMYYIYRFAPFLKGHHVKNFWWTIISNHSASVVPITLIRLKFYAAHCSK